jgi:hypothetical protein
MSYDAAHWAINTTIAFVEEFRNRIADTRVMPVFEQVRSDLSETDN